MIYCFDIDGTICTLRTQSDYEQAEPFSEMIDLINKLHASGHYIKMYTARGCTSGIDHTRLTIDQLGQWGVKYDELIMNKKPHYDLLVDDKAINAEDFRRAHGLKELK